MGSITGGAPLLAIFEKWPAELLAPFAFSLRGPGSDLHLQHIPLVDSHRTGLTQKTGAETAPAPEFRRCNQPALHRIAMHVAEFFSAFAFAPYIEIVKPLLPDVLRDVLEQGSLRRISPPPGLRQYTSRESKFHRLHHGRRSLDLRLADQQVNMFGH